MNKIYLTVAVSVVFALSGCSSAGPNTKKGAVIGGLLGAAAGGVIGHQDDKHAVEGALIGAAAGATVGGVIGNRVDKKTEASSRRASLGYLTVTEVAQMAKDGLPSSAIIDEIDRTKSKYRLTSEIIAYLKESGVEDVVIDHMLETAK